MLPHVPHAIVTSDTRQGAQRFGMGVNPLHNVTVAFAAGVFRNFAIKFSYADRFGEISRGKSEGMVVAVYSLDKVFVEKTFRGVAVIAGGHVLVAAFDPTVIMVVHDMTVGAGHGIIEHIGCPIRVYESEGTHTDDSAQCYSQHRTQGHSQLQSTFFASHTAQLPPLLQL